MGVAVQMKKWTMQDNALVVGILSAVAASLATWLVKSFLDQPLTNWRSRRFREGKRARFHRLLRRLEDVHRIREDVSKGNLIDLYRVVGAVAEYSLWLKRLIFRSVTTALLLLSGVMLGYIFLAPKPEGEVLPYGMFWILGGGVGFLALAMMLNMAGAQQGYDVEEAASILPIASSDWSYKALVGAVESLADELGESLDVSRFDEMAGLQQASEDKRRGS